LSLIFPFHVLVESDDVADGEDYDDDSNDDIPLPSARRRKRAFLISLYYKVVLLQNSHVYDTVQNNAN